jgi:broad specificity phosphatase PhoE
MTDAPVNGAGTLYLVRHGRTGGNGNRYVGWQDEPLDEVGREQARAVAERLADARIDAVYASPLSRALDTARPLADRHGLELRVREELKEINYGAYQGVLKGDRKLRVRRHHLYDAMPGGESLHDVFRRIERLHGDLEPELRAGRGIAAVGHFWSLRMLVGVLGGVRFEELFARSVEFKPENGSVWRVQLVAADGGPLRAARTSWI